MIFVKDADDHVRDVLDDGIQEPVGLAQGVVLPLPLGAVPRHLRESVEPPVGVTDGGDLDTGPEPRAVLADAPALVLEPTGGPGRREPARPPAASDVLLGVEARGMLAHDLI